MGVIRTRNVTKYRNRHQKTCHTGGKFQTFAMKNADAGIDHGFHGSTVTHTHRNDRTKKNHAARARHSATKATGDQ